MPRPSHELGLSSLSLNYDCSFLCAHLEQRQQQQQQQQQCGGTEPRLPQNPDAGGDYSAVLSRTSPESGLWCWSGGGVSSNRVSAPPAGSRRQ
ncbi:hypothetical protein CSOJ01_00782 [Colletotrichum sojae]|uniref:Uncharacterized protein n=1 Tax=Colletotrichum sojae TaxID=2175907 RepID=A0A8H6JXK5_9PEZI|nr:hypothetical protein CSOJ01_00782 [Colletotrichum sojae]